MDPCGGQGRSHWTDEQIRRRDGEAKNQSFFHQDDEDADEDEPAGDLGESYFEGWSEQEVSWYQEAREQEHRAWIQFQQARRTLRDARARQAEVKASRRFFKPGKGSGKGKAPVGANPALGPCLKCGKNHRTTDCPRGLSSETEKGLEVEHLAEFTYFQELEEMPAEQHDFFNEGYVADTLSQIDTSTAIAQGKAVLDPGATRTMGSLHAVEALISHNMAKHGVTNVNKVDLQERPTFGFHEVTINVDMLHASPQ